MNEEDDPQAVKAYMNVDKLKQAAEEEEALRDDLSGRQEEGSEEEEHLTQEELTQREKE